MKPRRITSAGYRIYGSAEVARLQQILFYRELGLELGEIRAILDDPGFDPQAALQSHLEALEERRARLDALILTVRKTIDETKGGQKMSDRERFEAFKQKALRENEAQYGPELRKKYDPETLRASSRQFADLTTEQFDRMTALAEEIQKRLERAVTDGLAPEGEEGLAVAALHREWLCFTWPKYTPEAHRGLGELYVADGRFTAYYDKTVPGCAAFLRAAIAAYTQA